MALRHRTPALALLAVAALLTAGCGTGSDGGTPGPTTAGRTPTPSAPASSPTSPASASTAPAPTAHGPSPGAPSIPPASPPPPPSGSAAGPSTTPWCTTDRLRAGVRALSPGAGQRYAAVVLTNSSGTACRTRGWVGAQLLAAGGTKVPTVVVRDHSAPAAPVRLAPGGSAWARLHWTTVPTGDEPETGACRPTAATVLITAPDQYDQLRADWKLGPVCAGGRIEVLPLAPGTGPS